MMKSIDGPAKKFSYVGAEELKEWNNLFNDQRNWGIRTELQDFSGVRRDTLNRILLVGRAYEPTIEGIRRFVAAKKSQKHD